MRSAVILLTSLVVGAKATPQLSKQYGFRKGSLPHDFPLDCYGPLNLVVLADESILSSASKASLQFMSREFGSFFPESNFSLNYIPSTFADDRCFHPVEASSHQMESVTKHFPGKSSTGTATGGGNQLNALAGLLSTFGPDEKGSIVLLLTSNPPSYDDKEGEAGLEKEGDVNNHCGNQTLLPLGVIRKALLQHGTTLWTVVIDGSDATYRDWLWINSWMGYEPEFVHKASRSGDFSLPLQSALMAFRRRNCGQPNVLSQGRRLQENSDGNCVCPPENSDCCDKVPEVVIALYKQPQTLHINLRGEAASS